MTSSSGSSKIPVGLMAQFWRHSPRYGAGLVLLGIYQFLQWWFDTRMRTAVNLGFAGQQHAALVLGAWLIAAALAAFGVRVLSRVAIFNGGRIAEYELRKELLEFSEFQNITARVVREISTVYSEPAMRRVRKSSQKAFKKFQDDIGYDRAMRNVNRLGNLCNEVLVWPDLPRSKVGKVLKPDIKARLAAG